MTVEELYTAIGNYLLEGGTESFEVEVHFNKEKPIGTLLKNVNWTDDAFMLAVDDDPYEGNHEAWSPNPCKRRVMG